MPSSRQLRHPLRRRVALQELADRIREHAHLLVGHEGGLGKVAHGREFDDRSGPVARPRLTMDLRDLSTPSLLLDRAKLAANIARMNAALAGQGVAFRPHMKTAKSAEIGRLMTEGWSGAVTVSTLKEAEQFLAAGFTDILYAVGVTADKLARAAALRAAGADLSLILDSVAAAEAVAAYGEPFPVLIEIDSDGHRAGVRPDDDEMLLGGRARRWANAQLRGVMTHGGGSYDARSPEALTAPSPRWSGPVRCARREALRARGLPLPCGQHRLDSDRLVRRQLRRRHRSAHRRLRLHGPGDGRASASAASRTSRSPC